LINYKFSIKIIFFSFKKAPEVIQQKDPNCYSTSADVYAYGCVLFEMFSGKLPHTPISSKEQVSFKMLFLFLIIFILNC